MVVDIMQYVLIFVPKQLVNKAIIDGTDGNEFYCNFIRKVPCQFLW